MWSVWVGLGSVGWSLGHQWQKSMTDIYQINILATFKLEQICKISLDCILKPSLVIIILVEYRHM